MTAVRPEPAEPPPESSGQNRSSIAIQVARFGVVGILATLTHFGVLTGLVEWAEVAPATGNGIAFLAAVLVTYLGQSLWVFHKPTRDLHQVRRFMISAVGGLGANVLIMMLMVNAFGFHYRAGFVAAIIIVPAGTFLLNRLWVFGR